ncbi:MAG: GMC family oxidoreductase N-terminal domain-containing protein, partial [Actinomycetota bacterium]|nr:GMC family oxidoreductase N-terminal domain-containing protein [Actinomycetota bacterium]
MSESGRARHVLASLARGVLGPGYVPEVPERMMRTASLVASEKDRRRLFDTLNFLDTKRGALVATGKPVPVSWLPPSQAEALVQRWKWSKLAAPRRLAGIVITLATTSLYGYPCREWDVVGYDGPLGDPPKVPKSLEPIALERDETLDCDVVIVGSGAGGGCAAARLSAAGLDVVVVEKGGYFSESDFHHFESRAMHEMYLYGGTLTTSDLGCRILAGSALGGGTLVNYATAFKTPAHVLTEWARVSGVEAFANGEMQESLDDVGIRIGITTDESSPGRRDSLMEEGLVKLGWHVDALPKAVRGCRQDASCGYCGFGCRVGAKQSTMRTYLEDAQRSGARIVPDVDVRKIRIRDGRAVGVDAICGKHRVIVEGRAVAVAAGAIETPALLLRSGLRGRVGRDLHLHPGSAVWGLFDDEVRAWEGTTQARYSIEFRHWDG